jgi:hypothetical protein
MINYTILNRLSIICISINSDYVIFHVTSMFFTGTMLVIVNVVHRKVSYKMCVYIYIYL